MGLTVIIWMVSRFLRQPSRDRGSSFASRKMIKFELLPVKKVNFTINYSWLSALTVRIQKPRTPELFLECYGVARKKPIRFKMKKPPAVTVISFVACGF